MLKVYHIRHDFFIIQTEYFDIVIDPFKVTNQEAGLLDHRTPNYLFFTHEHFDHYNKQDIGLFIFKNPTNEFTIIAPKSMQSKLNADNLKPQNPETIFLVEPNNLYTIKKLKFYTINAYNINKFREDGTPFHPKQKNWVGYIIELPHAYTYNNIVIEAPYYKVFIPNSVQTIMHTGDSDNIPEYKKLPTKIDMLLAPVSGTYVMDYKEACQLTDQIKPNIAIPMHYGSIVGSNQDAEKFIECVGE